MICGKLYVPTLLVLSGLFLLLSPTSLGAEESLEEMLIECVERLETTTNELERSIELNIAWNNWSLMQTDLLQNAMTLNNELLSQRKEDAQRFKAIETSLNEYETEVNQTLRRTKLQFFGIGVGVGISIPAIVYTFFSLTQ